MNPYPIFIGLIYVEAWWNVVNRDYMAASYAAVKICAGIDPIVDWVGSTWGRIEEN